MMKKMATVEENVTRVYTINLGKAWISPQHRRTDRVVNMIREFATKHMKSTEIKLDQDLNRQIWSRGKTNPPRKVRVKMVKDEGGTVTVSLYEDLPEAAAAAATTTIESGGTAAAAAATVETKEPDITAPAETKIAEQSKEETKTEAASK
jgi:large subunit ribosomal protein L31e